MFLALVAHAYDHDKLPSEVYEEYLDHRGDYELLWAFGAFRHEQEQLEEEKAKGGRQPPIARARG